MKKFILGLGMNGVRLHANASTRAIFSLGVG